MRKKNKQSFTGSEEIEEAALEAKRNEFLDDIFSLHTKHLSHLAKKADTAEFLREFEEFSGEND
jgi:hypothetical protein